MSAPFRADHVGSLLRPDWLTEARELNRCGQLDCAALADVEDRAIEEVVQRQEARRNSPSVADCRPTFCCIATTSAMASSSTARSCCAEIRPAAKSSRAASTLGGRRRLPTWSARNGGVVRMGNIVAPSARDGQSKRVSPAEAAGCGPCPGGAPGRACPARL